MYNILNSFIHKISKYRENKIGHEYRIFRIKTADVRSPDNRVTLYSSVMWQ